MNRQQLTTESIPHIAGPHHPVRLHHSNTSNTIPILCCRAIHPLSLKLRSFPILSFLALPFPPLQSPLPIPSLISLQPGSITQENTLDSTLPLTYPSLQSSKPPPSEIPWILPNPLRKRYRYSHYRVISS